MNTKTSSVSKPPSARNATAETAAEPEAPADDRSAHSKRLRQSAAVAAALLRLIADSRKLLKTFSAPFLEPVKEGEPEKRTDARKGRQRTIVFSVAQKALDPNYPIKKSAEALIARSAELDSSLEAQAKEVKSKVLDHLETVIAQALKDANEPQPADFTERFKTVVDDLNREMDTRSAELHKLQADFQAEAKTILLDRIWTTRNVVAAGVLLIISVVGTVSWYAYQRRENTKRLEQAISAKAHGKIPQAIKPQGLAAKSPAPSSGAAIPAGPVPDNPGIPESKPATPSPDSLGRQDDKVAATGRGNASASAENARAIAVARNAGEMTVSGNGDPEAIKKSAQAIVEAIKAWNAENDAENARKKK